MMTQSGTDNANSQAGDKKDVQAKPADVGATSNNDASAAANLKRPSANAPDRQATAADVAVTSSDPHPTQAELDALREGTFHKKARHRDVKPDATTRGYKTR